MSLPVIKTSGSYDRSYIAARVEALKRSRLGASSVCQGCGWFIAEETHHWSGTPLTDETYPDRKEVTGNDLTALCGMCHRLITTVRRHLRFGASRFKIEAKLNEVLNDALLSKT